MRFALWARMLARSPRRCVAVLRGCRGGADGRRRALALASSEFRVVCGARVSRAEPRRRVSSRSRSRICDRMRPARTARSRSSSARPKQALLDACAGAQRARDGAPRRAAARLAPQRRELRARRRNASARRWPRARCSQESRGNRRGCAPGDQRPGGSSRPDRDEMLLVVRRVEARDRDVLAARGRVHEASVAQIDADVRQLRLILEEHEIAGVRFADRDLARGAEQLLRRARNAIAGLL